MTQTSSSMSTSKAVASLSAFSCLFAAAGFAVSIAANQLPQSLLQTVAQWYLHHKEMASAGIGWTIAFFLGVTAALFAVSLISERNAGPWLAFLSRVGRRATGRLLWRAVKAVCFLCGALAGFGGMGWLAAVLMLLMYVGIFAALQGLVIGAQMRPRP